MRIFKRMMGVVILTVAAAGFASPVFADARTTIKDALKEKTKRTGTLDLYDVKSDGVRNLRLIDFSDEPVAEGDRVSAHVNFRDINTGDVVNLKITVEDDQGQKTITETEIVSVEELTPEADPNKVYTDQEVQDAMRFYLDKQAEFTGFVMLFDEKEEKMRNLKLTEMLPEVRRLGNTYISTAVFADADSGEKIEIDITVKNTEGQLDVKRMRIRQGK